jgi:hypothetical protein
MKMGTVDFTGDSDLKYAMSLCPRTHQAPSLTVIPDPVFSQRFSTDKVLRSDKGRAWGAYGAGMRNMAISHVVGWRSVLSLLVMSGCAARAGDLSFSDPAKVAPPPRWAVGQAVRTPDLDVLPGFVKPPAGFGDVAFYWWMGDPLTKERLQWQIDQLAGMGISGLQVNYAHSDQGGRSYGLTYPSEPPLFSKEWWDLFQWFLKSAKQKGMAVSLSDYTLGFGQGCYVDEVLRENPDLRGSVLRHAVTEANAGQAVAWDLPANTVAVTAYQMEPCLPTPGRARRRCGSITAT